MVWWRAGSRISLVFGRAAIRSSGSPERNMVIWNFSGLRREAISRAFPICAFGRPASAKLSIRMRTGFLAADSARGGARLIWACCGMRPFYSKVAQLRLKPAVEIP